eukprot:m.35065 g.35065  ORF g.35065 m.35065 type:complete len:237 (+) comp10890_c0_seq1:993-1703(+)
MGCQQQLYHPCFVLCHRLPVHSHALLLCLAPGRRRQQRGRHGLQRQGRRWQGPLGWHHQRRRVWRTLEMLLTFVFAWTGVRPHNVDLVELATSMKLVLDNWNIQTQNWLRYVCYDRNKSVNLTMFLSALWHGLEPGYVLTFLTAGYNTGVSRKVRAYFRAGYQTSDALKFRYNLLTWVATILFLDYVVGPFVYLDVAPSFKFWYNFYFAGHIALIVLQVLTPKTKKKPAATKPKSQ